MKTGSPSDDLVREFLVESHENLDLLDRTLVALEQDPANAEHLAVIFRTVHTIKGTCGFLGFAALESISHVGENLLCRLRDGSRHLDEDITTALLQMGDAIRELLASIEDTGAENGVDYSDLMADLVRLTDGPAGPRPTPVEPVSADDPAGSGAEAGDDRRSGLDRRSGSDRRGLAETTLRVDVNLLDRLMTLAGELVLARNQIAQYTSAQRDPGLLMASDRLSHVTSALQEGVMKMRMQPIDKLWSQFPRIVRDLAVVCGKRVRLEIAGRETELDKTLVEAVRDPLIHLIRNCVAHGIELPEVRRQCGKALEGVITLKAFHEGGQINIEITDDGGGIPPDLIKRRALERGLILPDEAARLTDHEAQRLIFRAGFSTAEAVTKISGRGVGLDVVLTNIERIGGAVDVVSVPGAGTTFRIKIPLTLAIVPALIVVSGGQRFAIPQASLVELVRLDLDATAAVIERVEEALFYRLRDRLLPVIYLSEQLNLPWLADPDVANLVVVKADGRQFGLIVDAIGDTEEIVVKPLGKLFKGVPVFAGATIMGDGHVALILDVFGLAQQASVVTPGGAVTPPSPPVPPSSPAGESNAWLLFSAGGRDRLAVPLARVDRLEEFDPAQVERVGGHRVVQYRDGIMPLVDIGNAPARGRPASRQAIVVSHGGRLIGVSVDRIIDIATEAAVVSPIDGDPVIAGAAVIGERVTELVDLDALVAAALRRPLDAGGAWSA